MSREKLMALADEMHDAYTSIEDGENAAGWKNSIVLWANELRTLAASAESAEVVAYVNLEMWKSNKYWPDDCFHENQFDGCVRLIVHPEDRAATQEALE